MLRKASRHGGSTPDLARYLSHERREPVAAERVARERAAEIAGSVARPRVQRVRALDVLLDEVLVVLGDGDVEAAIG